MTEYEQAHAALGYALDMLGQGELALACFRKAQRLRPGEKIYQVYVPLLLAELGEEDEALALIARIAPGHGIDLATLRRDLRAMNAPASALNLVGNFIHARNFLRSTLSREAERLRNKADPGRKAREARAQLARCREDRRDLKRRFRASRVPEELRALAPWAVRFGVGDDYCRPYLLRRLPAKDRARLIAAGDAKAAEFRRGWTASENRPCRTRRRRSCTSPPESRRFVDLRPGASGAVVRAAGGRHRGGGRATRSRFPRPGSPRSAPARR